MEILSGPWAGLTLLLRQTMTKSEAETDSCLPFWLPGLLLFLSVFVLLLQLTVYLHWKLGQVEADLTALSHNHSAIFRPIQQSAHPRRRSVG